MIPLALLLGLAGPSLAQEDPGGGDPKRQLARAQQEEQGVLAQLKEIDQRIAWNQLRIFALGKDLDALAVVAAEHEERLRAAEDDLAVATDRARAVMRHYYRLRRRGLARVLFSAESPVDLRRRMTYLLRILRASHTVNLQFREALAQRAAALAEVEADRAVILKSRDELTAEETTMAAERARRMALLDTVRGRKDLALALINEREQAIQNLGMKLSGLSPDTSDTPQPFTALYGQLRWPVASGRVTRGFGESRDALTGATVKNPGVDISASLYSPVRAVADGAVILADNVPGYGLTVVLSHGDYSTVYGSCGSLAVRRGQTVREGEKIGTVGETGVTDDGGPRVHFEVRYHNSPQDPTSWLRASP